MDSLPPKSKYYSKEYDERLKEAFKNNAVRQQIIKEAESRFCGEKFRFFFAIIEFEKIPPSQKTRVVMTANKLVSMFVEPGAMYENGCLSSETRKKLLAKKNIDSNFFEAAKYEVENDIRMAEYFGSNL